MRGTRIKAGLWRIGRGEHCSPEQASKDMLYLVTRNTQLVTKMIQHILVLPLF